VPSRQKPIDALTADVVKLQAEKPEIGGVQLYQGEGKDESASGVGEY
jgi:hypothetical protein